MVLFLRTYKPILERLSMTFRQTAKTNLLQSVFRCLYSRAKIFVLAVNSLRKPAFLYFCVVYLKIRRKEKKNKR